MPWAALWQDGGSLKVAVGPCPGSRWGGLAAAAAGLPRFGLRGQSTSPHLSTPGCGDWVMPIWVNEPPHFSLCAWTSAWSMEYESG